MPVGRHRKVLLLFLILASAFFPPLGSSGAGGTGSGDSNPENRVREIEIVRQSGPTTQHGEVLFRLSAEIASDREAREKGLSGRKKLPEDRGMLFVLEAGRHGAFWMKGMNFPLDLLYFDGQRRLIKILHGLQPCDTCPKYPTPDDAAYVLEVIAGTAEKYGITTGTAFSFTGEISGPEAQ
jgi:uncharacterized membrane protein (UPF0127 family)